MNEIIHNYGTGDRIEFIETAFESGGRMSRFIMTLAPHSNWAKKPRHFHPFQTESFRVISGELNLRAGKENYVLRPGHEKMIVNKFILHAFWNNTNEEAQFEAEIYPPRNIEKGIRLTYRLSEEGKINKNNIPYNPFFTLVLMDYFDSYFAYIPWRIQRLFFKAGSSFAGIFGYK